MKKMKIKNKIVTMNKMYGDSSNHIACQRCGFCITCSDCNCNDNQNKYEQKIII